MIHTFILLVFAHFLCDFALQNDFVAKFKARYIEGKYNPMWYWVLPAHAGIHALAVLLITHSVILSLFMFITHTAIDYTKCAGKISFNKDQTLHLIVVAIITLLTVVF